MGIDNDKPNIFENLLNINSQKPRRTLPPELSQALILHNSTPITKAETEQTSLGQLDTNQEETATAIQAPANEILPNPLIKPENIEQGLIRENESESISSIVENKKESSEEDKPTEKPKLSLSQIVTNVLSPVLPLPVGMIMNVISTASEGNNSEEAKKQKSETKGEGDKTGTEDSSDNTTKTSLWDSFSKIFEPITKPFTQMWDGVKKQIGIEKLSDLFSPSFTNRVNNFMSLFKDTKKNTETSLQEAKKLQELVRIETTEEKSRNKAILEQQIREQRELQASIDSQRQWQRMQEQRTQEANAALAKKSKQDELARQANQAKAEKSKQFAAKEIPQFYKLLRNLPAQLRGLVKQGHVNKVFVHAGMNETDIANLIKSPEIKAKYIKESLGLNPGNIVANAILQQQGRSNIIQA